MVIMLVLLIAFTVGCDTELGHSDEDHDHDGDGVQDHISEDHEEEHEELTHEEIHRQGIEHSH
jgi:hypothetical protein